MTTPREIAEKISFDRNEDHHDGIPTHEYCSSCNVCKDCTTNNITQALAEQIERDAKIADLHVCNRSTEYTEYCNKIVAAAIRAQGVGK